MNKSENMLERIVSNYVEKFKSEQSVIDQEEMDQIKDSIKKQVLDDAVPLIKELELEKAKKEIELEVQAFRRKMLHKLSFSIIGETIFVAFIVGVIVNQVTNMIPEQYGIATIIIGSLVCVLLVLLLVYGQEK